MNQNQSTDRPLLYLEDLTVGRRFSGGPHRIDTEEIIAFATQFDPQPFHLNPDAAKDSLFGELVASGWHTAALTMKLLVTGDLTLAGGVIGIQGDLAWPRPTRPGDELRVAGEIIEITPSRSRPDRGTVRIRGATVNQRDEIVQSMTATLMVFRRAASQDS